jgi:hypothetical protein
VDATDAWTSSERFSYPTGSAAAPTLTFTGDPNTGIYSPGADEVAISTGGLQRFYVSNTIAKIRGSNQPVNDIENEGNLMLQTSQNTTDAGGSLTLGSTTASWAQVAGRKDNATSSDYAGYLQFSTRASSATNIVERMRITSAGLVGIGTSSPSVLLDVYGTGSVLGKFVRNNTGGASGGVTIGNNDRTYTLFGDSSIFSLYDNTAAATRLAVDTSGRVGIGTTSPADTSSFGGTLDINGTTGAACYVRTNGSATNYGLIGHYGTDFYVTNNSNGPTRFFTNAVERARIDSSGRLLVGTSTSAVSYSDWRLQISGQAALGSYLGATTSAYNFNFIKSRSSSVGTYTIVASGDKIGGISFNGDDGTDYETPAASIEAFVDGTPGVNDMPGRLVFSTTADGASSPTERMRIISDGDVYIGQTSTSTPGAGNTTVGTSIRRLGQLYISVSGDVIANFNRNTSDGSLIDFRRDGVYQGGISVSGTTVSYNGAHLSRWSQLPGGNNRSEILRGTVLSNIDEMCEWGDEENEQLNHMKVSDVEGDKNVSGVFQAWDDDDDAYVNDFYCAMTGDFIIRIGAGITVERGDLLMSAGDGTAKPQDDDIIRSKTIAKVTSTNVSCTYDDGSYCVPCVLMAC